MTKSSKIGIFNFSLHVTNFDEILTFGHALLRSELLMQSMAGLSLAPGIPRSELH